MGRTTDPPDGTGRQPAADAEPDCLHFIPAQGREVHQSYFELLASIYNPAGEQAGLCMVELLPGARNSQDKVNPLNMLKKV